MAALYDKFLCCFSTFCSSSTFYYPAVKHTGNCQPFFFHLKSALRRPSPTFSTVYLTPAPVYRHLFVYPGVFKLNPPDSRLSLSSKRFSNLSALGQTSNWILKFLPTNREHRISNFALRHDNAQFIPRGAQIVVGLITKTDLVPRTI